MTIVRARTAAVSIAAATFLFGTAIAASGQSTPSRQPATAPQAAFRDLNAAEEAVLDGGRAVVRTVRNPKKLGLILPGAQADELRSRIASLKPNYATEVIARVGVKSEAEAAALLERLAAALSDVKGYVGIRYYSTRQKTDYDLFDKMDITARTKAASGETIEVVQHMEPFDDFGARYEYRLTDSAGKDAAPGGAAALSFFGSNLGPIVYSYQNFKAVSTGNMIWGLYAFRDGENVVFYGIGGVKAFDMLGIFRDRLEASFMGRVTAFFTAMSEKLRN